MNYFAYAARRLAADPQAARLRRKARGHWLSEDDVNERTKTVRPTERVSSSRLGVSEEIINGAEGLVRSRRIFHQKAKIIRSGGVAGALVAWQKGQCVNDVMIAAYQAWRERRANPLSQNLP
jgi:hypothetical protein